MLYQASGCCLGITAQRQAQSRTCGGAQGVAADQRRCGDCHQAVVLLRVAWPLEHVQHALRDGEAPADVYRRLHGERRSVSERPLINTSSCLSLRGDIFGLWSTAFDSPGVCMLFCSWAQSRVQVQQQRDRSKGH